MAYFTSQLCGDLQLAVCLSLGDGAVLRPPERLWMSDKIQKQATTKAAYATIPAEMLVNVYRYHMKVKSVSCCYVHGSQCF